MKRPSFQFYPGDWRRDSALQACSLAARGLWKEMMCLMHDGEPYGHLRVGDRDITPPVLAKMVGTSLSQVRRYLAELESARVFSRNESGTIFSRRMVRDEQVRQKRAAGGPKSLENPNVPQPKDTLPASLPPSSGGSKGVSPAFASASASANKDCSVPSEPADGRSDSAPPEPPEAPADIPRHAGHVMQAVRKVLWAPDGKPPSRVVKGRPWTEAREMSVIAALLSHGETVEDCIKVCHGLKMLQQQGDIAWLEAGKVSLLAVYHTKDGPRDMFTQALDAYARGIPPPEPTKKRGGAPTSIDGVLDFSKFAKGA